MSESGYLVSQASKLLEVQSHVLRYWEEELLLPIGRNELGHRYYTRYDIQVILCIKELKKKGFPLKEIKKVIPLFYEAVKQKKTNSERDDLEREVLEGGKLQRNSEIKNLEKEKAERKFDTAVNSVNCSVYSGKRKKAQKAARAREQKKKKEQNRQTNKPDGRENGVPKEFMEILNRIVKERMKEQNYRNQEEEKCRKLDEKIRICQKARKEVAVAVEKEKQEKHRFFRKKKSDA